MTALISSAETISQETGPTIIALSKEPLDPLYQRALSGRYWQVGGDAALGGESGEDSASPLITSRSLYGSSISLTPEEQRALILSPGSQISTDAIGPDGEDLRIVARSVILPNIDTPVIMLAGMDQAPAVRGVRQFGALAISIMAALTIGLIAAVILQVRLGLRPLFALSDRVADVREGRAAGVEGEYPREIAPLASELNSLIAHNRDVVERARKHVANLAHALKTPLAVLTNEADNHKSDLGEIVGRQTRTMSQQVDHHLSRARAAARAQTIGARTDITKTVTDMGRTMLRIYALKDIDLDLDIQSEKDFRGEKADFDEIIGNLLDNACKWATARVFVRVTDSELPGYIDIIVGDDGPGIDAEDYETALTRGARLDEATPGTGFGLAIVDDLARAYKGQITLGRSILGGLNVELQLPSVVDV